MSGQFCLSGTPCPMPLWWHEHGQGWQCCLADPQKQPDAPGLLEVMREQSLICVCLFEGSRGQPLSCFWSGQLAAMLPLLEKQVAVA